MNSELLKLPKKELKKIQFAWSFYDWANSVYSLVITTAIFPIYYEAATASLGGKIILFGVEFINTALMNYVTAISFLIIAFISPILSGIADYGGHKKLFLKIFCYIGAISCICLYFFDVENPLVGFVIYIFASIGFWGSLVFYNSYLPEIAEEKDQDRLSANGFSLGYIGSVILLIISLGISLGHESLGLEAGTAAKTSFILTGIWWIVFSQVTYRNLPEIKNNKKINRNESIILSGFKELQKTWGLLKKTKRLKRFLLSYFIYNTGVQTVIIAAVFFAAKGINWPDESTKTTGLIVSIIIIQIIAIVGAFGLSKLSGKIGNLNSIKIAISIWIVLCLISYFISTPIQFYFVAATVGFVLGGTQSLSRSTYSKFLPKETKDTTSYFSFYDVSEKIGLTVGLFTFGLVEGITGDIRLSLLSLMAFFLVGFVLLSLVPKEEETIS